MENQKKLDALDFGKYAEDKTAEEYIKNGYVILERNWRLGKTEIDIIAQKGDMVVMIEVKARAGNIDDAMSAITGDKRKRMVRAADAYIRNLKGEINYRFDISACSGSIDNFQIKILEDAFVSADLF